MCPDAREPQRLGAAKSLLLEHREFLPALASRIGGDGSEFETTIRGDSMSPAIRAGAHLRVRLTGAQPCRVGDVVAFMSDGGFMVHRVAYLLRHGASTTHLLTLGDNCLIPDLPVSAGRVLGHVTVVRTASDWHHPVPRTERSTCHRVVRATACTLVIVALRISPPTGRRLALVLRRMESALCPPVGRILRRLRSNLSE